MPSRGQEQPVIISREDLHGAWEDAHRKDVQRQGKLAQIRTLLRGLGRSRPVNDPQVEIQRKSDLIYTRFNLIAAAQENNPQFWFPEELFITFINKRVDERLHFDSIIALYVFVDALNNPSKKELTLDQLVARMQTLYEKTERPHVTRRTHTLTVGHEVEVGPPPQAKNIAAQKEHASAIDELQSIGIPVVYDGFREIPLPFSPRSSEQLRSVLTLLKSGLLSPDQTLVFHTTFGEFGGNLHQEFTSLYLIPLIMEAAMLYGQPKTDHALVPVPGAQKLLCPEWFRNVRGLPMVVRDEKRVEWRNTSYHGSFSRFMKGQLILEDIMECFSAFGKKKQQDARLSPAEHLLAQHWSHFLSQCKKIAQNAGQEPYWNLAKKLAKVPKIIAAAEKDSHDSYGLFLQYYHERLGQLCSEIQTELGFSLSIEDLTGDHGLTYGIILGEINRAAHDNADMREAFFQAILELRQVVAEAHRLTAASQL